MEITDKAATSQEQRFDGVTLVKSKAYRRYADLLCSELDEGKTYTHAEVTQIIQDALSRPVTRDMNP